MINEWDESIMRNLSLNNTANNTTGFNIGQGEGFGSGSSLADALRAPPGWSNTQNAFNLPDTWSGGGTGNKFLNKDTLGGAGAFLEGAGRLASGWAALKNLKLTREAMENQQNQWNTNYEAQRLATNNAISNQNAWKQAQGRTDFSSYVGGKPAGTQYVG